MSPVRGLFSTDLLSAMTMGPEQWIALTSVIATTVTAVITLMLSGWRERRQQERDDRLRAAAQQREDLLREKQRVLAPRVRADLECRFLGPEQGHYITEVRITVDNIGQVRRTFEHMYFRLLGIRDDVPLERWTEQDPSRLKFHEKLAKADLVPSGGHYYFVEPGVRQVFTYVTEVPAGIRYVLAHMKLIAAGEQSESTYERVFTEERLYQLPRSGGMGAASVGEATADQV